jgi:hypothetical protein
MMPHQKTPKKSMLKIMIENFNFKLLLLLLSYLKHDYQKN